MLFKLIILFITLPLLDLILLLQIAELIGVLETIALIILTGLVGAGLAKKEGIATWRRLKYKIRNNESPSSELLNGALVLAGSVFLLTPGLITDLIGFTFLFPFSRKFVKKWVTNYLIDKLNTRVVVMN